ncbi:hypothetical protein QA648_11010 [Rhizobium sp. CB3171]|uniref:hypothetical protein n=1 Tax=Rhizobium sp. CB3171 TaxID=3039157 RepID=UPI0024B1330A|nr:hypothetical protein [Rhizobium sp. CB3171]WFU00700.1 hypothetical protein QA648_11010 [Rhizobium sp. CB3171]
MAFPFALRASEATLFASGLVGGWWSRSAGYGTHLAYPELPDKISSAKIDGNKMLPYQWLSANANPYRVRESLLKAKGFALSFPGIFVSAGGAEAGVGKGLFRTRGMPAARIHESMRNERTIDDMTKDSRHRRRRNPLTKIERLLLGLPNFLTGKEVTRFVSGHQARPTVPIRICNVAITCLLRETKKDIRRCHHGIIWMSCEAYVLISFAASRTFA